MTTASLKGLNGNVVMTTDSRRKVVKVRHQISRFKQQAQLFSTVASLFRSFFSMHNFEQ